MPRQLFKKVLMKCAILQSMNIQQEFWHGLDNQTGLQKSHPEMLSKGKQH